MTIGPLISPRRNSLFIASPRRARSPYPSQQMRAGKPWKCTRSRASRSQRRRARLFAEMEQEGRDLLAQAGADPATLVVSRNADMRYSGQGYEIMVPVPPGPLGPEQAEPLRQAFYRCYRELFGRYLEEVPSETMSWRATVSQPPARLELRFPAEPAVKDRAAAAPPTSPRPQASSTPRSTTATALLVQADDVAVGVFDRGPPAPELLRRRIRELHTPGAQLLVGGVHVVHLEDEVSEGADIP